MTSLAEGGGIIAARLLAATAVAGALATPVHQCTNLVVYHLVPGRLTLLVAYYQYFFWWRFIVLSQQQLLLHSAKKKWFSLWLIRSGLAGWRFLFIVSYQYD